MPDDLERMMRRADSATMAWADTVRAPELPGTAITASDTGDGVVILSCDEVPGLTLPVSIEAYREFTAALTGHATTTERARWQTALGPPFTADDYRNFANWMMLQTGRDPGWPRRLRQIADLLDGSDG